MIYEALFITLVGMGSVFFFLLLLISVLIILKAFANNKQPLSKIAAAIAVAKNQR